MSKYLEKNVVVVFNAIHAKSGGGLTYIKNITKNLCEIGDYEVHIIIHKSQFNNFIGIDERARVHVVEFSASTLLLLFWEQLPLIFLLHDIDADVIISPANYGPIFARNHIIVLQNSLAVGAHEERLKKKIYWYCLSLITSICLVTSSAAIAVSNYVVKTIRGLQITGGGKISVIPHGVSEAFYPGHEDKEDFILVVGDIYVQKNFHNLVLALSILASTYPDIKLKIAGRVIDVDYKAKIDALIKKCSIENNIEFLGHCEIESISALYRKSRVFVFPSIEESFGMPVVEAMASGCAIACSNAAAMPEVAGDAVFYFDPENPEDIARAISTLWDRADLCADLSVRAVDRAKLFNWGRAAADLAAVINKIAAARRHR